MKYSCEQMRELAGMLLDGADAIEENYRLREEVEYWKNEHMRVVNDSIKKSKALISDVFIGLMEKGAK